MAAFVIKDTTGKPQELHHSPGRIRLTLQLQIKRDKNGPSNMYKTPISGGAERPAPLDWAKLLDRAATLEVNVWRWDPDIGAYTTVNQPAAPPARGPRSADARVTSGIRPRTSIDPK